MSEPIRQALVIPVPRCYFCLKHSLETKILINGMGCAICDECVEWCSEIIEEREAELEEKN